MSNSAISFNTAGLASTTSPGLVGTGAQTFAGKKTLDGGALIKGDTSGVAIASGYIGQVIQNHITSSVNLTSNAFTALGSITLSSGIWQVSGCLNIQRNGATISSLNAAASIMASGDSSNYGTKYLFRSSFQLNTNASSTWNELSFGISSFYVRSDGTNLYFADGTGLSSGTQVVSLFAFIGTFSTSTPFSTGRIEAIRIA